MQDYETPVPHLMTIHKGPLHHIEEMVLSKVAQIETWFRKKWQETPPPLTSSVDLRHSELKLAPVDTNLFPAGFNNLNPDFLPLGVQAAQAALVDYIPDCKRILLLPESHTRNPFYLQHLSVLKGIFTKAGFIVRVGSLDPELKEPVEIEVEQGEPLLFEPLQRQGDKVGLEHFNPCMLLLNNDLSTGIPDILKGINQRIRPTEKLGWTSRLKSRHFSYFEEVAKEFAELVRIDPWLISPLFTSVEDVDFIAQEGLDNIAQHVETLLKSIQDKYDEYHIKENPFVAVKADSGTYGMSVMMVQDADQIKEMNRKQRKKMAASKGSQKVERVIIQEGVYSTEIMPDGSVAEPVVYMIGQYVVGGFYRVHKAKGSDESLNAPGMHFEPLAFCESCNTPRDDLDPVEHPNRFYAYGVIARLAALAAAREIAALGDEG